MWGGLPTCGRLSIGLRTARRTQIRTRRPIDNRPQVGNPPYNGISAPLLVLVAAAVMAHAAGPADFGMAEFDAAVAAYNQTHKLKINKPKLMAELNLEPPETFRVEPYTAGGAHITGGD